MQGNCCRFKKCTLFKTDGIFKWDCIHLRNHNILCKTAKLSGSDETVMLAEGIITFLTILTFHARYKRNACYASSWFYLCHTIPDFFNNSGKLMSQYIWEEMACISIHTWHIRTTDSCIFYFDQYLSFFWNRFFNLFITNIFSCVYNSCFHFLLLSTTPDILL